MPYGDPGTIIQVDVEDDAKGLVGLIVVLKSRSRVEQHAVIAMLLQESFHPLQRARIIIHDKNGFAVSHGKRDPLLIRVCR
jgi:hypothetical protein